MNKLITTSLFILLLSIFFACGRSSQKNTANEPSSTDIINKDITVADFIDMYDPGTDVLLDVRTPKEWDKGHLSNAVLIDFRSDTFESEIDKLDKNKSYYIYCHSGGRSGKTLAIFRKKGFAESYNIKGGFSELSKTDVEIVKD